MSSTDDLQSERTIAGSVSAVGRPQGTFDVDANGQATYRISIEVPPGIAGSQPRLELVYNHRQSNGVVGVGWTISGLSAITRTKATYAVDGFNAAVAYDNQDRYSLDGQRLINVDGDYGQPGTLYYTEIQSWSHVRAGLTPDAGFTVVRKNGAVSKYGTTPDSLILAAGSTAVRVWALSSVTDLNGNSVQYSYTASPLLVDGSRGAADVGGYYIDRIDYTAHDGTDVNRSVQFTYESRPDSITDYIAGHQVETSYRLNQITTLLSGNPVRSYVMTYQLSTATQLSRLETITESGPTSASVLPPTTMIWQDVDQPGFDIGPQSQLNQHLKQIGIQQIDVSGGGSTDIVQLWYDENGDINASTYLATPGTSGVTFVYAGNSLLGSFPQTVQIFPADVNGDGRTDLLVTYEGSDDNLKLSVFLSNGTGFDAAPANPFDTGDSWLDTKHLQFFPMDANGDGRTDFVEAYSHHDPDQGDLLYFRTYLSKFGDGPNEMFTASITSATDDPATPPNVLAFWPMDVNGDGMMDVVRVGTEERDSELHVIATAYVSVSTGIDAVSFDDQVVSDLGTFSLPDTKAFLPVDVNGNGTQDLLQVWQQPGAGGTTLHLTTFLCDGAGGFVPGPDTAFVNQTLGDFHPMGFNGWGMTALVNKWFSDNEELMFTVYLASPSGNFRDGVTFPSGSSGSAVELATFYPCDCNGDGKADLIRMSNDSNQQVLIVPYTSSGPYPDLINKITNSLGGVVTLNYLPLSDPQVYQSTVDYDYDFPKGTGRRYPNPLTPTQFPTQAVMGTATCVVSTYSQSNDPSLNRFTQAADYTMTYSGARLDMLGRGWEGFSTVSKLDTNNGRVIVQTFNQDFPFTGTLELTSTEADGTYATDPRVPKDQTALLLSIASSRYEQFTRAQGATGLKTPVVEVLKTASRLEFYNYGEDQFDYALAQNYAYDNYGNRTAHAQLGYTDDSAGHPIYPDNPLYPGSPLTPAEVVYRYKLYQNDVFPDGWALGFLLFAKVTANSTDADITQFLRGDYHLVQNTYKASTYNLASKGRWDNVHNNYVTISYDYDVFGNCTSETQPGGFVTRHDYEPDYNTFPMRMISPQDEQGVSLVTVFGYDPRYGVEVAHLDANNYTSITGLDAFGRKAIRQGPVPDISGAQSDSNALTPLVTGTPEIRQAFLAATVVTTETTVYLDDGQAGLYTETQSLQKFPTDSTRGFTWKQQYVDGQGRKRETVAESGQSAGNVLILTDYDSDNKPTVTSLPFFSTTSVVSQSPHSILYTYDVLGRPLTHQTPAGKDGSSISTTTWEYGTDGLVTMTSAAGSNTPYVQVLQHRYYDGEDKVRQMTVPADGNATTTYDYDPIARLRSTTDPATATSPQGISNTITYDSLDRKLTFDNPDQNTTQNPNVKAMTYEYDPTTGLLHQQTDAGGQVTTFAYDQLKRITTKTLGDGRVFHYTYDNSASNGEGRLTQVKVTATDNSTESQDDFGYDKYGSISTTTLTITGEASPFITSSIFDPQLRLVGQTMPDGSNLVREYSFGQLISQSLDGAQVDYPLEQYSALGKACELVYGQGTLPGAGVVTDYTYNPAGQVYGEVVNDSTNKEVLDLTYDYDLLTQIQQITDQNESGNNQVFKYLNKRLQSASVPGFDPADYDYDASGNLTTKEGVSYTYQAHFPISGTASGNTVYSATPDACGRTRTRSAGGQDLTFDYDGLGNLRRVSKTTTGDTLREILSDYVGRRIRQTDEKNTETLYISSSYQVSRPAQGSASVIKHLLDERGAVASITSESATKILYFRRDHKGSVTHTFGQDGTVLSTVAYSGYGQLRITSGPDDFDPKYEHRQWDDEIGLYYFNARYYDPMTGRFLTPDSELGGKNHLQADVLNRYAFELNNPINLTDENGHMASWVGGLIIGLGLLAAGALTVVTLGAASPLLAAATGALIAGGLSATAYSVTHPGNFSWKDFGIETGISAGVGLFSGGAFYGLSYATSNIAVLGSTTARSLASTVIGSAIISSAADVGGQALTNLFEGKNVSDGLANAAIFGAIFGGAGGAMGFGFEKAVVPRYTLARYGEQIEQQATKEYGEGVNNMSRGQLHADLNPERPAMTSFPRPVDERVPILQKEQIEKVMNSRIARFTQLAVSWSSAFPEAYLENRGG